MEALMKVFRFERSFWVLAGLYAGAVIIVVIGSGEERRPELLFWYVPAIVWGVVTLFVNLAYYVSQRSRNR